MDFWGVLNGFLSIPIVSILIGAILTIWATIEIEKTKKPILEMEIVNHDIVDYSNSIDPKPACKAKFLYVALKNETLKWPWKWLLRSAALQSHGTIKFYHLEDGTSVFSEPMPLRFSALPAPEVQAIDLGDRIATVYDLMKINLNGRYDVYPGDVRTINIVARFDKDEDCYGWTHENMISEPRWRTPKWRMPKGRYLVKVQVLSSGETCEEIFRLINDVSIENFRLMPALPTDKVID
jgi:hypothetical protein